MKDIMALQRAGLQGSHYLLFVFFVWDKFDGGDSRWEIMKSRSFDHDGKRKRKKEKRNLEEKGGEKIASWCWCDEGLRGMKKKKNTNIN